MQDLPARLRDLRKSLGLNLQEVAPLIGVHFTTLGKWETGKAVPGIDRVDAWVDALGLEMEVLVRPRDVKRRKLTPAQEDALHRIVRSLPWIDDRRLPALLVAVQALETEHADDPGEGLLWARQYPGGSVPSKDG